MLNHLLDSVSQSAGSAALEDRHWHGHRTFFVDGSGCSMPDTPVWQEEYGQPGEQQPGSGFPVARLLALFHAGTELLTQLVVSPLNTHELSQVQQIHPAMDPGDVLVTDRGLSSYAHIALLVQAGLHALMRVGARQMVDFTPYWPFVMPGTRRTLQIKGMPLSRWIMAQGQEDQRVEWCKPKTCPPWLDQETLEALPASVVLRELRYQVSQPGFRSRLITAPCFASVFSSQALQQFQRYLSGFIVSENKTVEGINRLCVLDVRNQSSLNRLFTESPFSVDALNQARLALVQRLPGTQMKSKGVLSLDDTLLAHYGKPFDKIAYLDDSAQKCYVWAHNLVNLHYRDDQTDYPVNFRLWEPADLETLATGLTAAGVNLRQSKYSLKDRDPKKW